MSRKPKTISFTRVLSICVASVAVTSKALAAVVAPISHGQTSDSTAVWSNIRGELEEASKDAKLNPDLVDYVRRSANGDDIEGAVRLSYSMVSPSEVAALDKLWVDTLVREGGSDVISVFMVARSKIDDLSLRKTDNYLDNYVWKVSDPGDF